MENYGLFQIHGLLPRLRANIHFEVRFRRIISFQFPAKDEEKVTHEGRNGQKGVFYLKRTKSEFILQNCSLPFPNVDTEKK